MPSFITTVQVMISTKTKSKHCMFMSSPFKYDCSSSIDAYVSLGMGISLELGQVCLMAVVSHIVNSSTLTLQWLVVAAAPAVLRKMPPAFVSHSLARRHTLLLLGLGWVEGCIRGVQAAGSRQIVWVLIIKGSLYMRFSVSWWSAVEPCLWTFMCQVKLLCWRVFAVDLCHSGFSL